MKKMLLVFSPFIGGALGAVITVLVLVLAVKAAPMDSRDLLSFVLSTVTIVIAAFTVLGAVIVVMTWNDIDERTGKIVAKYAQEAKTGIEDYRQKKEAEIDENARVRQEAIDHTGQQFMSLAGDIQNKLKQNAQRSQLGLGLVAVFITFLFLTFNSSMKKWDKRLSQVERSIETKVK
jgi:hypothetical protein